MKIANSLPLLVFPMAGLSSRFNKAGYSLPKYMLPAHGRPIFDHVIRGFSRCFTSHRFLFICRDIANTPGFVRSRLAGLGLSEDRTILQILSGPTEGQSETVALGLDAVIAEPEIPITIFNIDTIHHQFRFPAPEVLTADGYLEVFRGTGDHWSFVRPGEADRVVEVTEKLRISDLCSSGLYHFKSVQLFLEAYQRQSMRSVNELMGAERYIAPLYNDLIAGGRDIRFHVIDQTALTFCGVPAEYDDFVKKDMP